MRSSLAWLLIALALATSRSRRQLSRRTSSSSSWTICAGTSLAPPAILCEDAEYRSARARRRVVSKRLLHHAALLAVSCQLSDRAIRPHPRHRRQHGSIGRKPPPVDVSDAAATRRVRNCVRRQVAHGQRRLSPAGLRQVGELQGQGQYLDPEIAEGDRTAAPVRGYITDILNSRALEFVRRTRTKPFLLYLSHKAVHPNIRQLDDGTLVPIDGEMFVPAESIGSSSSARRCLVARISAASSRQARVDADDRRSAAAGRGHRHRRGDCARTPARACGR